MKKIYFTISCIAFCFIACDHSDATSDTHIAFDSSLANAASKKTTQNAVADSNAQLPNMVSTAAPVPAVTATSTGSNTAGLNPAHGQPGHRCDIAVGAPLNSAPAKPATVTTATQPVITTNPASTAAPVKTAPGMNPPHGQPGHRCDIAVGAPLNSAPVKPATITTNATPAVTAEIPATAKPDSAVKQ